MPGDNQTNEFEHILETLRYGPDRIIVNQFDEQVWLAGYAIDGYYQQGLVDCCVTESPCNYHAALYDGECPVPWVPALEFVQHWTGVHAAFMIRSTTPPGMSTSDTGKS